MTAHPVVPGPVELQAPGLVVRLVDGAVEAVTSADGGVTWLAGSGTVTAWTPDGPVPLGPPEVGVDVDEVETARHGGGLRVVVRHGVEQGWTVRLLLANESDVELRLEQVRVGWCAAPRHVVTALAAGAEAAYAVQPADGDGPVLVGRLRSGSQAGVDADGLLLGPLVLAPGHRRAVAWRWEVVPDARRVPAGELPATTWLDLDRSVVLPGGPDVAVVAPDLQVEVEDDRVEVAALEARTATVELRSARGTTAYALTWAPELDDLVDDAVRGLLAGPTTPAGTPRLSDADAGLVVQDALARQAGGAPDELVDALELLAGELVDRLTGSVDDAPSPPAVDPVELAFLGREADRTGDDTLLDAAVRSLLTVVAPVPGLGLAGTGLALALVRAGRPAAEVVAHLTTLRPRPGTPVAEAGLELALLLRARDAPADGPTLAALRRLGAGLGAGLPGRVVPPSPVVAVAYASTLLGLVDEPTGQRLRQGWGITASELARRAAAEARARVRPGETGPGRGAAEDVDGRRALTWLVLGRR